MKREAEVAGRRRVHRRQGRRDKDNGVPGFFGGDGILQTETNSTPFRVEGFVECPPSVARSSQHWAECFQSRWDCEAQSRGGSGADDGEGSQEAGKKIADDPPMHSKLWVDPFHGATLVARDVDICCRFSDDNLRSIQKALS